MTKPINTMTTDALVPCVARSSATMVLIMQDTCSLSTMSKGLDYLRPLTVAEWEKMQILVIFLLKWIQRKG